MTHILSLPRLGAREALLAASAAESTCKTGGIISSGPYLGLLYPVVTVKALYHPIYVRSPFNRRTVRCRALLAGRRGCFVFIANGNSG